MLITFISIFFTSLLAYSTVFGAEGLPDDIGFLEVEGNALKDTVAPWFGTFFWVIGAFSLFAATLGIVDYTCRLSPTCSRPAMRERPNESSSTGSGPLLLTNRKVLSGELRISGFRLAVMVRSIALFGTLSVLVIIQQYRDVTG